MTDRQLSLFVGLLKVIARDVYDSLAGFWVPTHHIELSCPALKHGGGWWSLALLQLVMSSFVDIHGRLDLPQIEMEVWMESRREVGGDWQEMKKGKLW